MAVSIKSPEEIEKMHVAGKLAAEVLDFIAPHVKPGTTTAELDRLCHDYITREQDATPAPLNYAPPGYQPYPKSICTSVNHVVCHGVPGDKKLRTGDIINIDITVIKDGYHGDTSRMFYVGRTVDSGASTVRRDLRMHVARHRRGAAGSAIWAISAMPYRLMPKATAAAWCASSAATASAGNFTRNRRSCITAGRASGSGWSQA